MPRLKDCVTANRQNPADPASVLTPRPHGLCNGTFIERELSRHPLVTGLLPSAPICPQSPLILMTLARRRRFAVGEARTLRVLGVLQGEVTFSPLPYVARFSVEQVFDIASGDATPGGAARPLRGHWGYTWHKIADFSLFSTARKHRALLISPLASIAPQELVDTRS